ncbi:MAG: V-type ATP synthase subunit D [Methanobacteriota archaeon]|uniref:A-type ATP synthase subunit D n=1 Tax=Marine Group III euryarchaeote TaxID=2173149 RepID=A0A7J4GQP4_9ARCH|nr:MAG: V-type ATP synthase subunit D [Euryarchaeota archaeon]HIF36905.1 V-type ATP synthase subunit D [Marine Group III euryarchaeote]
MSITDVKPTRSELIATRKRIKLSISGHKLLKMKRDGLIIEFFDILPKVKDMRSQLVELYTAADKRLAVAMVADGKSALKSAANCRQTPPQVELSENNIMGVVVPKIKVSTIQKSVEERGYGLIGTSVRIDESVHAFEKLAEKVLEAAELETTMKKLLDEIESTKRRVNALEFKVIPNLEEIAAYITLRLEELERENVFRLKRIKG